MRRYTVRINETDHVVDVEELATDTFTVYLEGGQSLDVVLTDHQELAGASLAPALEVGRTSSARAALPTADPPSPLQARPERTTSVPASAARRSGPPGGGNSLTAPMPGVINKVEVAVGASVVAGQTLVVLEAMKMMNELKSQRDGRVAAIRVNAGDQVKYGDVLVEFEG